MRHCFSAEVAEAQLCSERNRKLWDALLCSLHSGMGKGTGNKWNRSKDLLHCSGCGHSENVSICLISGNQSTPCCFWKTFLGKGGLMAL